MAVSDGLHWNLQQSQINAYDIVLTRYQFSTRRSFGQVTLALVNLQATFYCSFIFHGCIGTMSK